jgi:hypothetical protein
MQDVVRQGGRDLMVMKKSIFLCFVLIWLGSSAFSAEKLRLQCEVLEVSKGLKSNSVKLNGIGYILLHHANVADRENLSKWLKAHSGTEVIFVVRHRENRGILSRLDHCFGRGLLIYTGEMEVKKRDIIEVILSPLP